MTVSACGLYFPVATRSALYASIFFMPSVLSVSSFGREVKKSGESIPKNLLTAIS